LISLSISTTSLEIRNVFEDDDSEWHPRWRFKHLNRHMAFVPRGFIRYYVLRLLSEKAMSGSEIIQHIEEKSGGRWRPSPGSVYPLLAWLQENKYVKEIPAEEPGMKRYMLTGEGKKLLEEYEKRRSKMEERFESFGHASFFEPPWLNAPEGIKIGVKADIELHNALWKLRRIVAKEDIEDTASRVVEILKETTKKIEELTTEKRTNK
jgi:DNA-binding PadR family transcriptional regulator